MSEQELMFPADSSAVGAPAGPERVGVLHATNLLAKPTVSGRLIEPLKWVISFPAMLGAILVGVIFYGARGFFVDPDVWWHIKVGQDILRTHHWPTTDSYSFTAANTPWIAYEWLGEVILGTVAKLGGNSALVALLIVTAATVVLALYYLGALRSRNCKAGFLAVLLLCCLILLSFNLRPQMFGYLFLVLLLIVLESFRQGVNGPLWLLPLLFLAWVNIHGSFIVGIGVLVVYLCAGLRAFKVGDVEAVAWSAKQRIQLELALLLSLAALPLTPYGTQLAVYPFDVMFNQPVNVANIWEWHSMPLDQVFGKLFLCVIVLMVMLQMAYHFTWRLEELLLAVGGAVMACMHARMLLLFVPFVAPIFATMLARWVPAYQRAKDQYVLNALVMGGIIAAMIHYAPSREALQERVDRDFPVAAVAYLDAHRVSGPMLNAYAFGGYLMATGRKVYVDGRADLYERTGVLADSLDLTLMKPGALQILDHYQIASCLLTKDEPLAVVLAASPKWRRVYSDGTAALFVRRTSAESVQ
jgi:hypothetical protein